MPTRTVHLEADLRDVVLYKDSLLVSRFRSAQLLNVGPDGTIQGNYDEYSSSYEIAIQQAGGIDLQLLGIGSKVRDTMV